MQKYSRTQKLWLFIALLHLSLVGLGASYVGYGWLGFPLNPLLTFYGELSGAGSTYGFFSPGIDNELRATFEITDSKQRTRQAELTPGWSHEAHLHLENIVDQFLDTSEDPEDSEDYLHSLSASLAGTVFDRYPGTKMVAVQLESFTPVSMSEYRQGKRSQWEPTYRVKFAKAKGSLP